MSCAFFDIETTGLEEKDKLTCAVIRLNNENNIFYTAMDLLQFMRGCPEETVFVTFNGLAFDFRVLARIAKNAGAYDLGKWAAEIAMSERHVDIMFAFLGEHGYYTSMNSFALPLELSKTWDGGEAAESTDMRKIVAYCESDVEILQQVYESGCKCFYLKRRAKGTGKTVVWVLPPDGFRTVPATLHLIKTCMPDQKWMSDPPALPSGQIQWTNGYRE